MSPTLTVIYRIGEDRQLLADIRAANARGLGVSNYFGVVGTAEWWEAVNDGRLSLLTVSGTVSSMNGGPMGDTAMFAVTDDKGNKTRWLRVGDQSAYVTGARAEVCYVEMPVMPAVLTQLKMSDYSAKLVVEIRLERPRGTAT